MIPDELKLWINLLMLTMISACALIHVAAVVLCAINEWWFRAALAALVAGGCTAGFAYYAIVLASLLDGRVVV